MRQGARKESKQTDERVERCNASQDQHGRHDQAGHEAEEEEVQARGDAPAEVDYLEHSVHGLRHQVHGPSCLARQLSVAHLSLESTQDSISGTLVLDCVFDGVLEVHNNVK